MFRTIKAGPYPWPNGVNDWRPAHIHFSVFGFGFAQCLITQMYFEEYPLIWRCPIVATIDDKEAVKRLISTYDHENTIAMDVWAWKLDNILRRRRPIMFENRMEGN